jgi:phage-related protein
MVNFFLDGANGDTIQLDDGELFQLSTGFRGTGLTASDLRVTASAGDGGVWRSTRKESREFDVPLTVFGSSRSDLEARLRRLAKILSDRQGQPTLRAVYPSEEEWTIKVNYVAGAETTYGEEGRNHYCQWTMTWQAPDPYWESNTLVAFSIGTGGGRGLLPELDELQVSSSQALGLVTIENPGDVDAYPVWTIEGPSTQVEITLNGVGFTYDETLVAADTITVDTKNATVLNGTTNKYGFLGAAPKLFRIPAGLSEISLVATGADGDTRISGYFKPRREVLY